MFTKRMWRLIGLATGLMASFVVYGVAQERIMTRPYGDETAAGEGEMFRQSAFLVLMNRIVAVGIAFAALLLTTPSRTLSSLANVAPMYAYAGVALSNFVATWCQYEALKHVNFPTQTLGKTGKMIPVMIIGALLHGKSYVARDYALNGLITVGCTAFVLSGDVSSRAGSSTPTGVSLMVGYLFVDGFTSTLQERLFKGFTMSTWNQMLYVNLCSGAISVALLVATGGLWTAIAFVARHPSLMRDALVLSLCAALGQVFIYSIIREFGALMFAGIMVTRQVVSVVVSCVVFFHPLTTGQILSAVLVFGTLFYLEAFGKKHSRGPARPATPAPVLQVVVAQQPQPSQK